MKKRIAYTSFHFLLEKRYEGQKPQRQNERFMIAFEIASGRKISPATIRKWRYGNSNPSTNNAIICSRILKVKIEGLFDLLPNQWRPKK
jgi:hypothetical protein